MNETSVSCCACYWPATQPLEQQGKESPDNNLPAVPPGSSVPMYSASPLVSTTTATIPVYFLSNARVVLLSVALM